MSTLDGINESKHSSMRAKGEDLGLVKRPKLAPRHSLWLCALESFQQVGDVKVKCIVYTGMLRVASP